MVLCRLRCVKFPKEPCWVGLYARPCAGELDPIYIQLIAVIQIRSTIHQYVVYIGCYVPFLNQPTTAWQNRQSHSNIKRPGAYNDIKASTDWLIQRPSRRIFTFQLLRTDVKSYNTNRRATRQRKVLLSHKLSELIQKEFNIKLTLKVSRQEK